MIKKLFGSTDSLNLSLGLNRRSHYATCKERVAIDLRLIYAGSIIDVLWCDIITIGALLALIREALYNVLSKTWTCVHTDQTGTK